MLHYFHLQAINFILHVLTITIPDKIKISNPISKFLHLLPVLFLFTEYSSKFISEKTEPEWKPMT